jgi:uncharacterized protein YggE
MKHVLFIISISLFILTGCKNEKSNLNSYVEVAGYAEQEVTPDVFYLNFTLSENNSSKSNINVLEKKIIDALQSLGIDTKKDLNVTGIFGENWNWWRRSKTVYQNKSYILKISDIDLLNKVCDKLDEIGFNNYYLGNFEYSKSDEIKNELQKQAVQQARIKAKNLLSGDGKKIDDLIYVQEQNTAPNYPNYYDFSKSYSALNRNELQAAPPPPTVEFRKIKMSYSVVVRYSIK